MQVKNLALSLALALLFPAPASFAQAKKAARSGSIRGVVTGQAAGGLGGVRVYVLRPGDLAPVVEAVTSDFAGRFIFRNVPVGTYTLRLSLDGWRDQFLDGVQVQAEIPASIAVALEPAPPSPLEPAPDPQTGARADWQGTHFGDVALGELPTSRTVWSLLENQDIDVVTQSDDVAQLETGTPSLFAAHGASWMENQYLFNGFDASDPYVTGQALIDPDYAALSEVTDVVSDKPASFATSGVNLVMDTPEPPSAFHGQTGFYFSDRALQSDNMDSTLVAAGFPGPERMNSLYDGNAQLGGALPLGSYSLPAFGAFSSQDLSKDLGGFAAPIDAHADHALLAITPYASGGRRLDLLYAGEQEFNSRDGADIFTSPSAARIRNDNFHQFQARWRDVLGPKSAWQAGFGVVHAILSSGLEDGPLSTSTLALYTSTRNLIDHTLSGSAPLAQSGLRTRYQANGMYTTLLSGFGSHSLAFGGDLSLNTMSNRWLALSAPGLGGLEQITVDGAGSEVIEWNTPAHTSDQVADFSVFAQDAWRPPVWTRWLAFPVGLRLDYSTGSAAGADNRISWTTLEPRAGIVFTVPHFPWVVARGGWSRYGHQLQGQYLAYGDPDALGGRVLAWDDANHDGIAQPDEIGQLLHVFGGANTGIAPGIERPYTDEFSVGFDIRVPGQFLEAHIRAFRRDDLRVIQAVDTGVPLSDYTPVTISDPYIDDFPSDAAYRTLTVYNEMPAALGHDFITLGNFPGYHDSAEGVKFDIVFHSGQNWEVTASVMGSSNLAHTPVSNSVFSNDSAALDMLGNNPNSGINNPGLTYFDRGGQARVTAYYNLPLGIHLGGIARWTDGLPYAPLLLVTGMNQGPFFVRAVPRQVSLGFRAQYYASADLRVSRRFLLRRGSLEADADIFNLLNANNGVVERDLADVSLRRRLATAIEAPRTARLGIAWRF